MCRISAGCLVACRTWAQWAYAELCSCWKLNLVFKESARSARRILSSSQQKLCPFGTTAIPRQTMKSPEQFDDAVLKQLSASAGNLPWLGWTTCSWRTTYEFAFSEGISCEVWMHFFSDSSLFKTALAHLKHSWLSLSVHVHIVAVEKLSEKLFHVFQEAVLNSPLNTKQSSAVLPFLVRFQMVYFCAMMNFNNCYKYAISQNEGERNPIIKLDCCDWNL